MAVLLDSVYELEGLVHLALNRDNPPSVLGALIQRKAEAVSRLAREASVAFENSVVEIMPDEDDPTDMAAPVDNSYDDPEDEPEPAPETFSEPEPLTETEPLPAAVDTPDQSEYDAELNEEAMPMEDIPMETVSPEYALGDEYTEVAAASPTESTYAMPKKGRGKPAFSLNDRYRFRRTLFKGNDAEYQGAMSVLAGLDSYSEAEAYFINTLGWNPEDEEVMAFMELLQNWYK